MSILDQITVLILTHDEEPNIGRALAAVSWAPRVVVVDSGSRDATLEIAKSHPRVEVVPRAFDTHANQWSFALAQARTEWVLTLDADYEPCPALIEEIRALAPPETVSGYQAPFVYRMFGRPLRSALYPPRIVLFRRARGSYIDAGHTQREAIDGDIVALKSPIWHDDRKPLARWLASQQRYARVEVDHLLAQPRASLRRRDKLRLMGWPAPIVTFLYTLFVKRCLLDGWPGWLYVLQRTLAETMIAIEIVDRRLRPSPP